MHDFDRFAFRFVPQLADAGGADIGGSWIVHRLWTLSYSGLSRAES